MLNYISDECEGCDYWDDCQGCKDHDCPAYRNYEAFHIQIKRED